MPLSLRKQCTKRVQSCHILVDRVLNSVTMYKENQNIKFRSRAFHQPGVVFQRSEHLWFSDKGNTSHLGLIIVRGQDLGCFLCFFFFFNFYEITTC